MNETTIDMLNYHEYRCVYKVISRKEGLVYKTIDTGYHIHSKSNLLATIPDNVLLSSVSSTMYEYKKQRVIILTSWDKVDDIINRRKKIKTKGL
jgi:hypothetical protein